MDDIRSTAVPHMFIQCKKYVITNYCRLSVLEAAAEFVGAFVTGTMTDGRVRANYENDMQDENSS
ncbi:hypothetical protein [Pseudomonas syringae]|uniref:hypothetical protein n=1 Tax=Pseudomonas syringae TaxID=317 RepID=UPI0018E5FF06|nr:hypothetical protein [Pseudomonas syringae]MBI6743488.1 hypothetical protein [Pseudomonas syringae]MBI6758871.1 hypothetical protein [Pseudomonas syringae]MBI6828801.1 hypothetical protein [Pseudomonas syringae]